MLEIMLYISVCLYVMILLLIIFRYYVFRICSVVFCCVLESELVVNVCVSGCNCVVKLVLDLFSVVSNCVLMVWFSVGCVVSVCDNVMKVLSDLVGVWVIVCNICELVSLVVVNVNVFCSY